MTSWYQTPSDQSFSISPDLYGFHEVWQSRAIQCFHLLSQVTLSPLKLGCLHFRTAPYLGLQTLCREAHREMPRGHERRAQCLRLDVNLASSLTRLFVNQRRGVCVCVCKRACSGAILFPARKNLQNLCYANSFPPSQLTHSIMCKPDVTVQRMNEYVPRCSGFDSMHYEKRALESISEKLKEGILKERKTSVVCRIELVKIKQSIFIRSLTPPLFC